MRELNKKEKKKLKYLSKSKLTNTQRSRVFLRNKFESDTWSHGIQDYIQVKGNIYEWEGKQVMEPYFELNEKGFNLVNNWKRKEFLIGTILTIIGLIIGIMGIFN